MKTALIAAVALLTLQAPAFAQDAPAAAAPAPEAMTPEAAGAPAEPAASTGDNAGFSDAELSKFAVVAQKVNEINTAGGADAQAKMVAAVQASGLAPNTFNDIATKMQSHEGLRTRIAELAGAAAAGASTAEPTAGS